MHISSLSLVLFILCGHTSFAHINFEKAKFSKDSPFLKTSKPSSLDALHTVTFAVKKSNFDQIEDILNAVSFPSSARYGERFSKKEVDGIVQNEAGSDAVEQFLEDHNEVSISWVSDNRLYYKATSTLSTWNSLLRTEFLSVSGDPCLQPAADADVEGDNIHTYRALSYTVPPELEGQLEGILGVVD